MLRFIKVFIVIYVFSLAFIGIVAGGDALANTASPIAIIDAVSALFWCWLKRPSLGLNLNNERRQ